MPDQPIATLAAEMGAAAEAATGGNWRAHITNRRKPEIYTDAPPKATPNDLVAGVILRKPDAKFIALANPANVLTLLASHAAQAEEIRRVRDNIPMDYLERHPGDLVAAMRDFAKDRWTLIDRITAKNGEVSTLSTRLAESEAREGALREAAKWREEKLEFLRDQNRQLSTGKAALAESAKAMSETLEWIASHRNDHLTDNSVATRVCLDAIVSRAALTLKGRG